MVSKYDTQRLLKTLKSFWHPTDDRKGMDFPTASLLYGTRANRLWGRLKDVLNLPTAL